MCLEALQIWLRTTKLSNFAVVGERGQAVWRRVVVWDPGPIRGGARQ